MEQETNVNGTVICAARTRAETPWWVRLARRLGFCGSDSPSLRDPSGNSNEGGSVHTEGPKSNGSPVCGEGNLCNRDPESTASGQGENASQGSADNSPPGRGEDEQGCVSGRVEGAPPQPQTRLKLLHVDNSPQDLAFIRQILHEHDVTSCTSLQQAYVLVRERGLFDCLLLGLDFPGMSGADAADAWRMQGCDRIPVLALSDTTDPITKAKCMMTGSSANRFVPKNLISNTGLLERQIREAIRHQQQRLERGISGVFDIVDRLWVDG